jgi:hypothetical protein
LLSLVAWSRSTPPVFYFQLPAYPHTGSSLMCFGCCSLCHKLPDYFTILTFSPSSFCESSPVCGARCRLTMTSADFWGYHMPFFILTPVLRFDIRPCLRRIILRSLRVNISAFHSCGLCIYASSVLYSMGLLFVVQHHPHYRALYAVSVRRLECLPPASFRFHLAMDTLALG